MRYPNFFLLLFLGFVITLAACDQDTSDDTDTDNTVTCNTAGVENQSTIAEIEAMRQAMLDFRNSLSTSLSDQASTCLDDERLYLWHNTPNEGGTSRDGIIYGDLSDAQLEYFSALLQLFLSTEGYQKVTDISVLAEGYLSTQASTVWNPDYYSIDLFGDPETSGSWGFQLDGHHLAVNFLIHGDNVSIVPAFFGGEPAVGTYNGTDYDVFDEERDLGLDLYNQLTDTEKLSAVSTGDGGMQAGPASQSGDVDPYRGDYDYSGFATGLKYSEMSSETQAKIIVLMKEYVYTMTTTFADQWWTDISNNLDDTYFVWIDDVETPTTTSPFYYRIYNPYFWAEYNAENALGGGGADYNHVHTITRIPNNPATANGGDYGIFASIINQNGPKTLLDHYAMAGHHRHSIIDLDYEINQNKLVHKHNSL